MADSGLINLVMRLNRKRIIDEEEKRKKVKIIISITASIISVIAASYTKKFIVKEPSQDWDQERQRYLKHLYDGSEVDSI